MGTTIFIHPDFSQTGTCLLAKNADREASEPQVLRHLPRQSYPAGSIVRATYIALPAPTQTQSLFLSGPDWCWGGSMGANESGLAMTTQPAWSRFKMDRQAPGLLGMDLVRVVLERARGAREGVEILAHFLQEFGPGGSQGYRKKDFADNVFLLADPSEGWLVEWAGREWGARQLNEPWFIQGNRYRLGRDFQFQSPRLIETAVLNRWCRDELKFHLARDYTLPLPAWRSGSRARERFLGAKLEAKRQKEETITLSDLISLTRLHTNKVTRQPPTKENKSICRHGGPSPGSSRGDFQTTASFLCQTDPRQPVAFFTGRPLPCLSVYLPYLLKGPANGDYGLPAGHDTDEWRNGVDFCRQILKAGYQHDLVSRYQNQRDILEGGFLSDLERLRSLGGVRQTADRFSQACRRDRDILLQNALHQAGQLSPIPRHPRQNRWWRRLLTHPGQKKL